ncbi:type IV toxin-antitoxin system AbiEi family antitoxin domain-containing protein [Novosphingobium terrae]|uniref:type IV toxin-antitoxin system AbiEi family antitoxin domain-containing protein n=1 Tax=Novosphingobium terrae TaxID=2726189 RepID=UPI00197E7C65|nr:AbiEi antitoxin N-terminal domain-containing protein [Novosphingobium terrae]
MSEGSQREKLLALFRTRAVMRASELKQAGITAAALLRAVEDGELERLSRGLYQRCLVDLHQHHELAVAAMRVPKGVIAMISALMFHGLMDEEHPRVWMAIGPHDWAPAPSCPPLRIVRFAPAYLRQGVETHVIGGVHVPVYGLVKTLADVFRHPRLVDREIAVTALRRAVREGKASPAAIEEGARTAGVWPIMRPYLAHLGVAAG